MRFGDRLHDLRTHYGFTAREIAIRVGCSERSVHQWEAGTRGIQARHLAKLAKLFNLSMDELFLEGRAA